MKKLTVTASKTYDITIGENILKDAGQIIKNTCGGQTAAVVTDDRVASLYGKILTDTLEKSGYRVVRYVIPQGEASKNTDTFIGILNFFADEKFERTDTAIALGGGTVGDVAGFSAACYMRGVNFVQIPTTLLSITDSSVGGKTAVNLPAGKNLAGVFYQPNAVICDISLLATLTPEIYRDGCAEIIKYGVISDLRLFGSLKKPINEHFEEIIYRCIEIKRDIVAKDEFESGERKLLNFGHTIGHAIEKLSGYKITHGCAVAAGMAIETRAAVKTGVCEDNCLNDLLNMLKLYNLPVETPYKANEIFNACLSDKKRSGDSFTVALPEKIGKCVLKKIKTGEFKNLIRYGLGEI